VQGEREKRDRGSSISAALRCGKNKKNNTNELILILLSLFRACLIDSGLVWGREEEIFEID